MDLLEIREKIDAIDDKIIELYKERMALSKEVGVIKAHTEKVVFINQFSAGQQR